MKFQHAAKIITCFLALLGVLFQLAVPALAAQGGGRKVVRVGVLNNTTFADQDDGGAWSGIDIECMIAVAQKAGFDLEFIDSSSDPDFLGSLDKGTYDIVADVVKTPEREGRFLFTDEAIGHTNSTLAVRADDDRWDYGNIEQIAGMKVGVLGSYANNAGFRSWCRQHGVAPAITEYQDMAHMTSALLAGEIDGEVYTAVYNVSDAKLRTVMKFLPEAFYYAFRSGDTALKSQVDDALSQILTGNADYLITLKNKYEDRYKANELPFSAAETAYIKAHPEIRVAVIADDEPYYEKMPDGSDGGVVPDYYSMIAGNTGLTFRYIIYDSQEEAVSAVKNGQADVVGIFSGGIISSQQYGLELTDSFSTVNSVLLTKSGTGLSQIQTVAVRRRAVDSLLDSINEAFPGAQLKKYENARTCFQAMKSGEADAVLIGLPSATWMINQTYATAYSIIPMPGATSDLCGAVNNDGQVLCSILNKRIGSTKNSFDGLVTKDTLPGNDWKTMIMRVPPALMALLVCVLLALVVGLGWTLVMLRRRQRERTAVLAARAETELQKTQVEAIQKSADERNSFFANISHDMRTPLNAITNFIRLAQKDGISPEQRKGYLDKAESSSKLMLDLIDDTLTVSKLSGGKLELRLRPCRLAESLETVAAPIREAAEAHKIHFQADLGQLQDAAVLADELNVEKIFLNLLTNAVRYTPAGGHVWYTARQDGDSGSRVCCTVTVRDDGIGISKEFLPYLFDPFSQEKRRGYESVGTGLGLSIVNRLVTLMGGSISVESEVGKGTAFVVHLCFDRAAGDGLPAGETTEQTDLTALAGKKVLLCEDNALNREIAAALLDDKGMSVVCAENGQIGLDIFSSGAVGEFAAVLMDIRMPVMNGLQTARAIRALNRPDAKTVPIIAMTADAFADDVEKCLEAGMNGHLAKPIDPEAFYRTLYGQISGGAAEQPR